MSLPRQPLQVSITGGKRRKRVSSCQVMSNKSLFLLLVVATLLQWSVVSGQESSLPAIGHELSESMFSTALRSHRRLEENETILIAQQETPTSEDADKTKEPKSENEQEMVQQENVGKSMTLSNKAESDPSLAEELKSENQQEITVGAVEATNNRVIDLPFEKQPQEASPKSFNVTAISMTTCVKIEYAVSYLTSLDWKDIDIVGQDGQSKVWSDVYLLQLVLLPSSLTMVFFGSQLLLPVCTMTAAGLGVFCIFHFVDNYSRNGLDCPMKLALSGVSATLAAMGAAAFVRFGLFTLGTVSAGGMSYLFFDAFPDLDPGLNMTLNATLTSEVTLESDLSPHAWIITILLAVAGGLLLRLYEQASLEVLTAILGGVGVSYSAHAFFLSQHVDLDRSVVFLIASFSALIGCKFQRTRRLRLMDIQGNPYHDYKGQLPVHAPPPPMQPIPSPVENNPNLSVSNWIQLQHSLYSTNNLLQQQRQNAASNEMEAMAEELTNLLNSFQERIQEQEQSKNQ